MATWFNAVFAGLTFCVAVCLAFQLRTRERRQALTDLHISLTSGETAGARDVIGRLLYSDRRRDQPDRRECIDAYFKLIWALQRSRNVFHTQRISWRSLNTPQSRLRTVGAKGKARDASYALSWNLSEIAENVGEFHFKYCTLWDIEDDDAWEEVEDYIHNAGKNNNAMSHRSE